MPWLTKWRVTDVVAVLLIICLGAAVVVPGIAVSRESARQRQCLANLRRLGQALQAYHEIHGTLPAAATWRAGALQTSMLMETKRIDRITYQNWAQLLLPHLERQQLAQQFKDAEPVLSRANARPRTVRVPELTCTSDIFNRDDNPYSFQPSADRPAVAEAARGNYAMNGGTHNPRYTVDNAAHPHGDGLSLEHGPGVFRLVGNGVAGINRAFSIADFTNGQSTLAAIDEIRAGVHPLDPRGVWALGQIGGSITWGHGIAGDDGGPNNRWPRADDILGCGRLHAALGSQRLLDLAMPCVDYVDRNDQATARSMHSGGVHVLFLDGAARFVRDQIDRGLWHVMHSRDSPPAVLEDLPAELARDMERDTRVDSPSPRPSPEGRGSLRSEPLDETNRRLKAEGGRQKAEKESGPPRHPRSRIQNPESDRPLPEGERQQPRETLVNSLGMRFVGVPAGTFTMGIPDIGNDASAPPECPPHKVTISAAFWMGIQEVTQRQYQSVMGTNPSQHSFDASGAETTDDFPVENLTWYDAEDFCHRLGDMLDEQAAGRRYRLPTEAEWEYACRSGKSEPYRWVANRRSGDQSGEAAGISPPLPLARVGSYPANPFGLYDMRGNVWEWCADWFERDYYSRSPHIDPRGPAQGFLKVVRGGDWIFVGEPCHINYPVMPPWKRSPFVGFRVVCEAENAR